MNYSPRQPKMHGNTPEATAILDAISKFGCIAISQIPYFLPASTVKRDNYPNSIISYLVTSKQIIKDGEYLCSQKCKHVNLEVIDSIWSMIEIIEKLTIGSYNISELLEESFIGNKPETVGFILNSSKVIRLIPVFSSADVTQVIFTQEKYYATGHKVGSEDESDLIYYLVLRNTELLHDIKKLNLTFPFKIAYLEGESNERPTIKLLQLPKQA